MNTVITYIIAILVIIFHFWASRRSPKYWYLGGIIPGIWIILLIFLFAKNMVNITEDWKVIIFPTLIFILIWIEGHEISKKKEIEKMKAKDIK